MGLFTVDEQPRPDHVDHDTPTFFGDDPTVPCACAGYRRRARFGVHHRFEDYKRLGLVCERRNGSL